MTDLLSVEDIKKAVGAFAGEQRAPPTPALSPLPRPRPLCTHGGRSFPAPLCPRTPSGAGGAGRWGSSAFLRLHPGGTWSG